MVRTVGNTMGSHSHLRTSIDLLAVLKAWSKILVGKRCLKMQYTYAVHVLTVNQGEKRVEPSTSQHAVNILKPKRGSTGKSTNNQKAKQDSVTIPRRPEDLIKEAMILQQPTVPASKRDAQYRKSYAYKIWKERGNPVLHSEPDEGKVMNAAKDKLPPGI